MHFLRLLAILLCALSAQAQAQARNIPEQAKDGELSHLQDMIVSINGVAVRLAPGAQFRDSSNRIIVPTALPAGAQVKYVVNGEGHVRRVWILTPEEAAKP